MSAAAIDQGLLEAAVQRIGDDALSPLRRAALDRFAGAGFPTPRTEAWRYTNLGAAAELSNAWLKDGASRDAAPPPDPAQIDALTGAIDAHWIVVQNGAATSTPASPPGALTVTPLSLASGSAPLYIEDPLASFNAALLTDGLQITVADGARLDKPVGILIVDRVGGSDGVSQTRFLINVGANASADFIEVQLSGGSGRHFANSVVQLGLADGARANYVRVQNRDQQHLQVGRLLAQLAGNASLDYTAIDVGGGLVRSDVVANIAGPGATANLCGVYLADGRQHIDNHIVADHRVGPAASRQDYRGLVGGRSRCVFNGKAIVREGADGTDAEQSNHNLLLSDTAEIDTKPELEIYADDVKCAHGTTVGQLDETALFYLRTRGLDRDEAARALSRAFVWKALARLPAGPVREYVEKVIEQKLDAMMDGEPS